MVNINELEKMDKSALIKKCLELDDEVESFRTAYKIVPNGEYYLHRIELTSSKVFYKIAIPKDPNAPLKEAYYPNFLKTPCKLVNLGNKNSQIPDKTKIRIKAFKEEPYKKGFDWIYTIRILDFDIIQESPIVKQQKEEREKVELNTFISNEDDLLF